MTMTTITTTAAETVMNPPAKAVPPNPAVRFLEALGDLDFDRLEECLAPDIWFRALLPHGAHASRTARETAATYRTWFEGTGQSGGLKVDLRTGAASAAPASFKCSTTVRQRKAQPWKGT